MLCLLSKLSPVEYTDEGERTTSRKFVDPVMRVIEKPCDLILKHMAVCFVSPNMLPRKPVEEQEKKRLGPPTQGWAVRETR